MPNEKRSSLGLLRFQVIARLHQGEAILATRIRDGSAHFVGRDEFRGDLGIRDHRPAGVGHRADNIAGGHGLGVRRRDSQKKQHR